MKESVTMLKIQYHLYFHFMGGGGLPQSLVPNVLLLDNSLFIDMRSSLGI